MKRQLLIALVGVNVLLGAGLIWRALPENLANAQAQAPRRAGDYVLVPAQMGGSVGFVFVLDQQNRELAALAEERGKIVSMPKQQLDLIFRAEAPAAPGTKKPTRPR
jgi:hypothetical protein